MNNVTQTNSWSMTISTLFATAISPQTRQLLSLGHNQGWDCRILGQAPMPNDPVRLGDYLIIPAEQDTSPMPDRTKQRVQKILDDDVGPLRFFVVHEAPKLLAAPEEVNRKPLQLPAISEQLQSAIKKAGAILGIMALSLIAVGSLATLGIVLLFFVAALALPLALFAGVAVVDPILVAVTEDGFWVEIDRWWNE